MRGFPLLNVLIVVAFFAAAWWPLQHLIGQSATAAGQSSEGKSEDISRAENLTLRATSSHPLETLTLEHLGQPLIKLANTDLELEVMSREAQVTEQLSNMARAQIDFDQQLLNYDRQIEDAKLEIELTQAALGRRLPIEKTGVPAAEIDN